MPGPNQERTRPTDTETHKWRDRRTAQGQPWRTEPEIPVDRQLFLVKRHQSVSADYAKKYRPLAGVRLTRADIEWLNSQNEGKPRWSPWDGTNVDFRRSSLRLFNPDLQGINLSGLDLAGAELEGADLTEANVSKANLSFANLRQATLRRATLAATWLVNANLSEATLEEAILFAANLERAHLPLANLSRANLFHATLRRVNGVRAQFAFANLSRAILTQANFSGADMRYACLERATVINTELEGADLGDAELSNAVLGGAGLQRVVLRGARACKACFADTDLDGADLSQADLSDADLSDASLIGTATLGTDFTRAKLSGFSPRDFPAAKLVDADFEKAEDGDESKRKWRKAWEHNTGVPMFKSPPRKHGAKFYRWVWDENWWE